MLRTSLAAIENQKCDCLRLRLWMVREAGNPDIEDLMFSPAWHHCFSLESSIPCPLLVVPLLSSLSPFLPLFTPGLVALAPTRTLALDVSTSVILCLPPIISFFSPLVLCFHLNLQYPSM